MRNEPGLADQLQDTQGADVFYAALDYLSDGIEIADAEGVIKYVNRAYTRITGIPPTMRIGKNILEINPDGDLGQVLRTGKPTHHPEHGQDGLLVSCHPLWGSGSDLVGAVLILRDLNYSAAEREERVPSPQLPATTPSESGFTARYTLSDLVGSSPPFLELIHRASAASRSESTVLITGESGTGKEIIAHGIHNASRRSSGPFVAVNCAAVPEHLLESEFFGHEKGAFTGADRRKPGLFELARRGTIFLDEIGDMSLPLQAKVLRVLQERTFARLGSTTLIQADVRIIAATNADLKALVAEKRFREDLYYRLNVVRLNVPPLRERMSDLPQLAEVILKRLAAKMGREVPKITAGAMKALQSHNWPGNVRELENVLERAMNFMLPGERFLGRHLITFAEADPLPPSRSAAASPVQAASPTVQSSAPPPADMPLPTLRDMELTLIRLALEAYGSSGQGKRQAAQALGISLTTLYERINRYGIKEYPEEKSSAG